MKRCLHLCLIIFLILRLGIKIKFEGRAEVQWSENEGTGDSEKKVTYHSREQYFKKKLILEEKQGFIKIFE